MGFFDKSIVLPSPPIVKAIQTSHMDLQKGVAQKEMKSLMDSPFAILDAMGFKEKPSMLSYKVLERMATRNAVVASVINTRVNQVSTFTKPKRFTLDGLGFEIRTKDANYEVTDEDREIMHSLELFLENMGFDEDSERDDFDTFIRKLVRDSLIYDQACFEIVSDRRGRPACIHAVDGSTIRFASEDYVPMNDLDTPKKNEEIRWVQVIDGSVQAWFTKQEMAFAVRNPRSNINVYPYGFSELEQLIQQVTSHLFAEDYNARYFSQGGTTKGILNIKGEFGNQSKEHLEAFKRQWQAQCQGLTGAWKTPVLNVKDGLEYINVNQSNREMEFEKWMNYLVNITCAVYQIDPAEINFPNNGGAGGGGGGIFEGSNATRLQNSKDKGLRPLLRFVESTINKYIISRFSNKYVFNFVGMDSKTDKERIDIHSSEVKVFKTINEIRKEMDLEPLEDGDTILDSSFINMQSQKRMMGGGGGGEEEDSTEDDDEDWDDDDDDSDWEDSDVNEEDEAEEMNKSETTILISID